LGVTGPKTLALVGRCYDGVLLHPFITDEAISEAALIVHEAAEKAGRDPKSVKIWSTMVSAADQSEEETSAIGRSRLLTYMQSKGYGESLCRVNHWDPAVLEKVRTHPLLAGGRSADRDFTRYQTGEIAALFPEEWITSSAALGSAEWCAKRLNDHFDAGADGILIHGSVPNQVSGLLGAYSKIRYADRFAAQDPWMHPSPPGTGSAV
jgi:alkanesulfonate monooxygenase SsuD/methylene tetrahydromethanopterin reductase-like flavin-dependent oxidoreductase (luciferase family)